MLLKKDKLQKLNNDIRLKHMKVAIIMGSTSDYEIMSQAVNVLEDLGVEIVKTVISAHRTPALMC